MNGLPRSIVIAAMLASSATGAFECPVTIPDTEDLPEALQSAGNFVWVGNRKLAASVPADGHWTGMGPDRDYGDKWWWWREGYSAHEEPAPALVVATYRLDRPQPPVLRIDRATNAMLAGGLHLMLTGMRFPTSGCWEVVGLYRGHELSFVFKVGDDTDQRNAAAVPDEELAEGDGMAAHPDSSAGLDHFAAWLRHQTRDVFDGTPEDLQRKRADATAGDAQAAVELHFLTMRCPFVLDTREPLQAWFDRARQNYLEQRFRGADRISDPAFDAAFEEGLGETARMVEEFGAAYEFCAVLENQADVDYEALRWLTLAADLGHAGAQRLYHARAGELIASLSFRDPYLVDEFRDRADRYVRALIDAGRLQGLSLMSRMFSVGDVYPRDYVKAYAYAHAIELMGEGKILSEAGIRMNNAGRHLHPHELAEAERLARRIAAR